MNVDLPFEDWEIDLDHYRELRFRFVPTRKPLRIDDKHRSCAPGTDTPPWIVLSSADGFEFIVKKKIYQRFVDVSNFLNDVFHFGDFHPSKRNELIFTDVHPYVMCACCKYLHWKYKYGDFQERPGFISNPKFFLQVLEAAKTLRIQVAN